MSSERNSLIFMSQVAEKAESHTAMLELMKRVVSDSPILNIVERNLLSIAYKNIISDKRTSWRIITSLERKESERESPEQWKLKEYKILAETIEIQLRTISDEILSLIELTILPEIAKITDKTEILEEIQVREALVFWHKMMGDYYRYIAELEIDESPNTAQGKALASYQMAMDLSTGESQERSLNSTNVILLGLALNFSVFYYEIMDDGAKACALAQRFFNSAIEELDSLIDDMDQYKETTLIMQLLRDNLSLWNDSESEE